MNLARPLKSISAFVLAVVTVMFAIVPAAEALARVGGGQSYGGGGGGGGSDGGVIGVIWLIFQLLRLLIYLTIEYPLVGIPLDLIVCGGFIYFLMRNHGFLEDPL